MIAKGLLKVSALAAVAVSATYAGTVYKATRRTDPRRMTRQNTVPDSLQNSKSVNEIVDPRGFSTSFDTRSVSIAIPPHRRNVSDEELLSRLTKAFFGGAVIRPERFVLQTLKPNLVNFSAITSKVAPQIWRVEQISNSSFLPIYTKIFGTFQVLDSQAYSEPDSSKIAESYIDVGFGVDQSSFAGVHRFSAFRPNHESQDEVILQLACQVASGPRPNLVASTLTYTGLFHRVYADLLFRESIGEVEKWLQSHD